MDPKWCNACGLFTSYQCQSIPDDPFGIPRLFEPATYYRLVCPHCGAATPWLRTGEEAIAWWNEKTSLGGFSWSRGRA